MSSAPMIHGLSGFQRGMGAFARAVSLLLGQPRLLPFVIIPFALTTLLYVGLVWLAVTTSGEWIDGFFAERTAWYWRWTGAVYFAWVIAIAMILATVFFSFVAAGTVIAAPFNEALSKGIEAALLPGAPVAEGGWKGFVADIGLAVGHALLRVLLLLALFAITLPLLFLPIVGQAIAVLLSASFLAWDGLDSSLSRRRLSFAEKRRFLARYRAATLGLGVMAYILFLVPLTALFVLPLNTAAGTVLYCEIKSLPAEIEEDAEGPVA